MLVNSKKGKDKMNFHIGDEVWWEDPDNNGIHSGKYEVVDIDIDQDILVLSNGSSIVEAFRDECVFPSEYLYNS